MVAHDSSATSAQETIVSKKHFIAMADTIREHNKYNPDSAFTSEQIAVLASYCKQQNSNFLADRWLGYIAGINGKNGGAR